MTARKTFLIVFGLLIASALAVAQQPCSAKYNGTLICIAPEAYGSNWLSTSFNTPNVSFNRSGTTFAQNFQGFNTSMATELSRLPMGSPASGILFSFDRSLGVVTRSQESYGPVLMERAETIGRRRLYLAASYQFYNFSSLDGLDLKHTPVVFTQAGSPDYVITDTRTDIKVHQVTFYATYGLTNRIDISTAIPVVDMRFAVSCTANIVRVAPLSTLAFKSGSTSKTFPAPGGAAIPSGNASGLGDVLFRVKGTVLKRERMGVALGMDVRAPTGDAANLLGSGATGVKPFVAASYRARVSPHANLGFEWNGRSIMAGDVSTGTDGKLPNSLVYGGGVDVGATKRWTIAVDLMGQRLSNYERISLTSFVDVNGVTHANIPQVGVNRNPANIDDLSVGAKVDPWRNLLLTANVMFKLNDAGLRAKAVPLAGISYSF